MRKLAAAVVRRSVAALGVRLAPAPAEIRLAPAPDAADGLDRFQVAAGGSFHAAVAPRTEFRDWTRAVAGAVAAFVGFRRREDRWGC